MSTFKLNPKQVEQRQLVMGPATFILAAGGSRSGKTAGFCHLIEARALAIPGSRTGIFRATAKAARETLFQLTYPAMSRLWHPGLWPNLDINVSDMTITYPNGSVVMFAGLDDNARQERILGQEYATLYLNEVSEIATFAPVSKLISRLAQKCVAADGQPVRHKFFFDCNPSSNKHWAYRAFVEQVQPETGKPLPPGEWTWLQMNPHDNEENLGAGYIDRLASSMGSRDQRRFISGEWQTEVEGALFQLDWVDEARVHAVDLTQEGCRIVVAVDPATSANPGSDETGIVVAAVDADGHGYVLDDRSMKGTPEQWAKAVAAAYQDWNADLVVYEANQGGLMVETTLRSSGVHLPLKGVHATRGKVLRAEPISLLYEKGKVSHVGEFKELEDQMANFSLDFNRAKQGSPDRLDALVWALTELMTERQHAPGQMSQSTIGGFWG